MFKGSKHTGWQQTPLTKHEQIFSHYLNNELRIASPDEKLDGCALEI